MGRVDMTNQMILLCRINIKSKKAYHYHVYHFLIFAISKICSSVGKILFEYSSFFDESMTKVIWRVLLKKLWYPTWKFEASSNDSYVGSAKVSKENWIFF